MELLPHTQRGVGQMLVLTRKVGESIVIGKNIRITVVAIQGDKTRIGIDAPRDMPVDREEVHDRKQESKVAAQTTK